MKKICLIFLLMFVGFFSACFGEPSYNKGSRLNLNLSTPDSVAKRANDGSANFDSAVGIMQDPLMNSMINGYGNMMQGMTGGSYNAIEQQRQQAEYVKQQSQSLEEIDAEE